MLTTSIIPVSRIAPADRQTMFQLYNTYYEGAINDIFQSDLDGKDYVIILRDPQNIIRGFSTLAVYTVRRADENVRVLYSGDTIIERAYWGENQFSKVWLEFAGQIKAEAPEVPLYWLLIVKGHRTYRYLSLFSTEYYPRHDSETPPVYQQLMHDLAQQRFGNWYDPATGLIRFPEPRSFLSRELAVIPDKDSARPEVKFFLERNPRYYEGDELLCLCELKSDKLTRLARQWFQEGARQKSA